MSSTVETAVKTIVSLCSGSSGKQSAFRGGGHGQQCIGPAFRAKVLSFWLQRHKIMHIILS